MKKYLPYIIVGICILVPLGFIVAPFATAGNPLVMTEDQMAKELQDSSWTQGDQPAKVTDVTCITKTNTTFTCMGTWTVQPSYGDGDADNDPPAQQVTWAVTVGKDGRWIANVE